MIIVRLALEHDKRKNCLSTTVDSPIMHLPLIGDAFTYTILYVTTRD